MADPASGVVGAVVHGLDTIPVKIADDLKAIFTEFLPGWTRTGQYNFQPGAIMQKTAGQLQLLVQNGPHPWINEAIEELLSGQRCVLR